MLIGERLVNFKAKAERLAADQRYAGPGSSDPALSADAVDRIQRANQDERSAWVSSIRDSAPKAR
jgi:hypothetical protein